MIIVLIVLGSFVVVDYVDDLFGILILVGNLLRLEFSTILVHVCQDLLLLDLQWVDDVLQVLLFVVEMTQREVEPGAIEDVNFLICLDFGLIGSWATYGHTLNRIFRQFDGCRIKRKRVEELLCPVLTIQIELGMFQWFNITHLRHRRFRSSRLRLTLLQILLIFNILQMTFIEGSNILLDLTGRRRSWIDIGGGLRVGFGLNGLNSNFNILRLLILLFQHRCLLLLFQYLLPTVIE